MCFQALLYLIALISEGVTLYFLASSDTDIVFSAIDFLIAITSLSVSFALGFSSPRNLAAITSGRFCDSAILASVSGVCFFPSHTLDVLSLKSESFHMFFMAILFFSLYSGAVTAFLRLSNCDFEGFLPFSFSDCFARLFGSRCISDIFAFASGVCFRPVINAACLARRSGLLLASLEDADILAFVSGLFFAAKRFAYDVGVCFLPFSFAECFAFRSGSFWIALSLERVDSDAFYLPSLPLPV